MAEIGLAQLHGLFVQCQHFGFVIKKVVENRHICFLNLMFLYFQKHGRSAGPEDKRVVWIGPQAATNANIK